MSDRLRSHILEGKFRVIETAIKIHHETILGDYDSLQEAERAIKTVFSKKKVGAMCWFSYRVYNANHKMVAFIRATKKKVGPLFTETTFLTKYF